MIRRRRETEQGAGGVRVVMTGRATTSPAPRRTTATGGQVPDHHDTTGPLPTAPAAAATPAVTSTRAVTAAATHPAPGSSEFDRFYRTHHADALRWAIALVGDRAVAEELAQDAMAAVGSRLGSIHDPPAYLRRTIANRAASWHRRHLRERRRIRRAVAGQTTSYTTETTEVLDVLAGLPHRQRAAVSLRYWADWTDDQIADALGCAPATVRVLVHRGLAALRKEIVDE